MSLYIVFLNDFIYSMALGAGPELFTELQTLVFEVEVFELEINLCLSLNMFQTEPSSSLL